MKNLEELADICEDIAVCLGNHQYEELKIEVPDFSDLIYIYNEDKIVIEARLLCDGPRMVFVKYNNSEVFGFDFGDEDAEYIPGDKCAFSPKQVMSFKSGIWEEELIKIHERIMNNPKICSF